MQDVRAIALGVLQMSIDDIERSSVADIMNALGWYRLEHRQWWELGRLLGFFISAPYDSKKKIKKPASLFPLPWDDEGKEKVQLTPEELANTLKRLDKALDQRENG